MNKQLFFFPLMLTAIAGLQAKVNNHVLSPDQSVTIGLPKKFHDKNVVQLKTFLRQNDNWSCGLRSLFHALAIEKALETPAQFEATLKQALRNPEMLHKLDRAYGKNQGLNSEVAKKLAHQFGIGNKLIFLGITKNGGILSTGRVRYHHPDTVQTALAKKLQNEMSSLVNIVQKAPQAVYFIVESEPQHAILFALVNLPNRPAKLYFIDSNNRGMTAGRERFIKFFEPYLTKLNKNKNGKNASQVSPAIVSQFPKIMKNHKIKRAKKQNNNGNCTNNSCRRQKVQQNNQPVKQTGNLNPALLNIWQLSREGKLKTTRPFRTQIRTQCTQSSCSRTQCPLQRKQVLQGQQQPNTTSCSWMQAIADKYGTDCPLRK